MPVPEQRTTEENAEVKESFPSGLLTTAGFVSLPVMLLSEFKLFRTGSLTDDICTN